MGSESMMLLCCRLPLFSMCLKVVFDLIGLLAPLAETFHSLVRDAAAL